MEQISFYVEFLALVLQDPSAVLRSAGNGGGAR
jgi:hypothetical protein